MNGHDKNILMKIRQYAVQAMQFRGNMDFHEFSCDLKTISACVFSLSQIGELSGKLGDEFVEEASHIPWRKMKGLRNRIIHDYEGVQLNMVWDVLVDFLPELVVNIDRIGL